MTRQVTPFQPVSTRRDGSPWSIGDASAYLGVSPRHLIRLMERDAILSIRLGRRRLIPDKEVQRLANEGC
jgi:excisionase family DNA binding protein